MKNSQKGFLPILLVLVVGVVAVGLGVYFYKKSATENQTTPLTKTSLSTEVGTSSDQVTSENSLVATSTGSASSDAGVFIHLPGNIITNQMAITNNSYRSSYLPGDSLNLIIKVWAPDGTLASQDRGFNVQVTPYNTDTGQVVYMRNGDYFGGNASFQNGVWTFTPLETLTPGHYYYDITAYCSNAALGCGQFEPNNTSVQTTKRYTFEVKQPAQPQIVTITNASPSAPQTIHNGAGQIFGAYKIMVNGSVMVANSQTFHLQLPVINMQPLQSIFLIDDNGNVVAGPVTGIDNGLEDQFQEFTFYNVTYQPGTHIYTIKGTIPQAYTQGQGFQLTTKPVSDWKVSFPDQPGISADLSSSGTVMLNQVYIGE